MNRLAIHYQTAHDALHARSCPGAEPLTLVYIRTKKECVLGWVSVFFFFLVSLLDEFLFSICLVYSTVRVVFGSTAHRAQIDVRVGGEQGGSVDQKGRTLLVLVQHSRLLISPFCLLFFSVFCASLGVGSSIHPSFSLKNPT